MRVLIVQKDLKNLRSGVSRLVLSELNAISKQGGETILVCERVDRSIFNTPSVKVIKTLRWPFRGFLRRRLFELQACYWINKLKPDVSVGHGDIANVDVCFMHNCVHLEHELLTSSTLPESHDVGRVHTQVLNRQQFKRLVCNSRVMQRDFAHRFHIPEDKFEVLYPSSDPAACENPKQDVRQTLGIYEDEIVIGLITSGNFKKRNVSFLLDITRKIKSDRSLHIVIAGNGKKSDFQKKIDGHPHSVHFLPSTDDVAGYYHMLDVFVLPAHIEEFGMSALEAMSCKLPVVLHSMVGASEILEGESRQMVLDALDRNAWVGTLQSLVADESLRKRLGEQNFNTAKQYSNEKQEHAFLKLLKQAQSSGV